ncbi:MAG: IS110 family transposase, partial [Nocardioidaceae bacterium]
MARKTVKARRDGHLRLLRWAMPFDEARLWAVEYCRHVAGRLVRDLLKAGEEVVMVPPKLMAGCRASARTRGKSDPIDALAVARGALRDPDLPRAHLDEESLPVRQLLDHREDLVPERTRMINRLRWHLVDLDPDLEPGTKTLTRRKTLHALADRLRGLEPSVRRDLAVELVDRILADTQRINELEREITAVVTPLAPALLALPGVAALTAAKLLGEVAGIDRFRTSAQLANLAGAACIPVWTGNREKHLNRGGNRQLNAALHRIAVTQIRSHPPAQELYQRRLDHHNDTKAGALRVLKRHLADVVFRTMKDDQMTRLN